MATLSNASAYPIQESVGSLKLHIYDYSSINSSNTISTGIPHIVGYWMTITSGLSTITSGHSPMISEAAGVLTISICAGAGKDKSTNEFKAKVFVISD